MMGRSHAAMGLAVGAGIGLAVFGLSSSTWLVSSVAVCGASILPDIDEPGSSISREFGIISQGFSAIVSKLAGGHRKLTHSLLGLGIVTLTLVLSATGRDASAVIFGLLVASAWRIVFPWWTGLRRFFIPIGVAGGYFFYHTHPFSGLWLVGLLAIGWLVHMAGDFLTHGGIPLLYPRSTRESLPMFGTTGSTAEHIFAICLYVAVVVTMGLWFSHAQYANSVGTGGVVILDFGGQINSSTSEEVFSNYLISDSQIQSMVVSYAQGFYDCSSGAVVYVGVGTNNSIGNGSGFGSAWAYEVNGISEAASASYGSKVVIFGANDVEPDWGTMSASESWSQGYASVSGFRDYIDNGSANGCSASSNTNGSCDNGWDQYGEWYVAYGAQPALSTPQIYYSVNASQWQEIRSYGATYQGFGISFWGPLDEYPRNTSTDTSGEAWAQLTGTTGQDPSFSLELQSGSI